MCSSFLSLLHNHDGRLGPITNANINHKDHKIIRMNYCKKRLQVNVYKLITLTVCPAY